jgi:hypothetical protein
VLVSDADWKRELAAARCLPVNGYVGRHADELRWAQAIIDEILNIRLAGGFEAAGARVRPPFLPQLYKIEILQRKAAAVIPDVPDYEVGADLPFSLAKNGAAGGWKNKSRT